MSREHLEDARETFRMIATTTEPESGSSNLAVMGQVICQALLDIDSAESHVTDEAWQRDARQALAALDRLPVT